MIRRKLKALSLCATILLIFSCGLPYYPYILSPTDGRVVDLAFYFKPAADNNVLVFKGYELYYKFYWRGEIVNPNELNLSSISQLESRGFLRVHDNDDNVIDSSYPLIPIVDEGMKASENYEIQIDFSEQPFAVKTISTEYTLDDIVIRRGVAQTIDLDFDQRYQAFTEFDENDRDAEPTDIYSDELYADLSAGWEVQLAMYAVSYGLQSWSDIIHSETTYLGSIIIALQG